MLPWDLEDWLTDEGDRLVRLDPETQPDWPMLDKATYEVWLLDTEARNGGLSQYFFNNGHAQWNSCQSAVQACGIAEFSAFAEAVNAVVSTHADPGAEILRRGAAADGLWAEHQALVVAALRRRTGEA